MRARDNPFSADRMQGLGYRLRDITWDVLLERLERLNWRGAIVGQEGSGKTTLLEGLGPRLRERGLNALAIPRDSAATERGRRVLAPIQAGLTARDVLLFDGAERLTPYAWKTLRDDSRKAGGLIVTSHRPGLLPTLVECATSPQLLDALLRELVPQDFERIAPTARALFRRHRGNIRNVFRDLYDVYADSGT